MGTLNNFKYKKIKDFLTKEEKDLLKLYCKFKHLNNTTNFDNNSKVTNLDTVFQYDEIFESLLINKKSKIEDLTKLQLLPTYSYWRMYTYQSELLFHKDREACEISVTVAIDSDGSNWPIIIDEEEIHLFPGDGLIYLGREFSHGRQKLQGNYHTQCFLHYVDANGPYKNFELDGRAHHCQKNDK